MQIDAKSTIEGVSIIEIRRLFRKAGGTLSIALTRESLELPALKAKRLLSALVRTGFLKKQGPSWVTTTEGSRLCYATAARALHRKTADRLLMDLLTRINSLNSDPDFLARIEKAVVFGSYLSDADRIGDVDVAIKLVPREGDISGANLKRAAEAEAKGRKFSSFFEIVCWWQTEAVLFLKNHKRGLGLHDYAGDRQIVENSPHRVIFDISESVRRPPDSKS